MRSGWSTLATISGLLVATQAEGRDATYRIDIGGGSLAAALSSLAAQTGVSIGSTVPLSAITVAPLRGKMTPRSALARLLRGSGLSAEQTSPTVFRIVKARGLVDQPTAFPDIIVTARKQSEPAARVPASLAVFRPGAAHRAGVALDAQAVAAATNGLAVTNLGPGRDRLFLRGVADSPFNGFSQAAVSVQLDEGRLTYDAADPGLRLVDVDRVEVLKGPQGPLYGTGALGGIYRIVVNRPVVGTTSASVQFGLSMTSANPGGEAEAIVNLPVVQDRVALRLVGYATASPGWIADGPARADLNQSSIGGGRAAVRVEPLAGWTIDLTAATQEIHVRDSQYVDREGDDLSRSLTIREPRDGRLTVVQGSVSHLLRGAQITIATSHAWQDQNDLYDASASSSALGVVAPTTYRDRRSYRVFDQEARIGSIPGSRFVWTVGTSYLAATTRASGLVSGSTVDPFFALHRHVVEAAVFADGSWPIRRRLRASIGTRVFRTTIDDELEASDEHKITTRALIGFTPSGSVSYDIAPNALLYLRFATAFRPGGIDPTNLKTGRYEADEVGAFDIGGRSRLAGGRVMVEANLFRSTWRDVQADYLQLDGLLATRNVGNAHIVGGEVAVDWLVHRSWRVQGGVAWQRGRLISGLDGKELPVDLRLPVAPDLSTHAETSWHLIRQGWRIDPYLAVRYVGAARLSFDPGLDRRTPGYAVARGGIEVERHGVRLRADIDNLFDARADTFAFGNPFSIRAGRQFTPLRPRSLTVSLMRSF